MSNKLLVFLLLSEWLSCGFSASSKGFGRGCADCIDLRSLTDIQSKLLFLQTSATALTRDSLKFVVEEQSVTACSVASVARADKLTNSLDTPQLSSKST